MLLTLGIGQVWAAEYTIKATDGFKSSYNETEATFEKEGVTYGYLAAMYNANNTPSAWYKQQLIQCRKHSASKPGGDVWNVTPLNISKVIVKLATSDKDFTLYYGSTEKPTSNSIAKSSLSATEETITYSGYVNKAEVPGNSLVVKVYTFDLQGTDASYFLLDNGNSANYIWEIIIQTTDGGGSDLDDCTAITPILTYSSTPLLTNSTATATLEGNTGNGEVTYTTSDDKVATVADDGTVTAVGGGTATITATITAAGEYCGGTATAKITVTPLISCSEVYNLADDETFVLKEFEVTYVNGKYSYIKDDTGYGLIFNDAGAYGLKAGDQVEAAELAGKKDTYNGLVEIIPTSVFADLEITSGTAPDPEVMNALPVKADMNKYVKFEDVTFASTTFSSKKVTGKINAGNITFYDQFATNATFNTSKKYDVIGAVSIYNSTIQVNFISAEEVAEPTLNVEITNADFGKIAINGKAERTLTLNGSLLTKPVSLAIEGEYFTLASNSITPTDGSISEAKIKITYKPTVEGTHTATLKITSDELAEQTITLQGQAVQQHTVDFYVNKEKQTELAKKVLSGEKLTEIPTATSCDPLEYPTFIGWSASEITGTTDVKPTDLLDLNTTITADCKYYAVFAKETSSTTSTGITYEVTLQNTNFVTNYNERTINITANEVGGDGTVEVSFKSVGVMKCTDASKGAVMQFRKKSNSSQPGIIYNTTDLGQINSITIGAGGTNNIASIVIGSTQQPTTQEDNEGFFLITNGTSVSYIPSITINFTQNSSASTTTYTYLTTCESATPTYTVTYDLDGGESTCETSVVVEQNGELTLCDAPTKTGHTFLNWKDQSDNDYEAGATITVSSNLTLTAQWQKESYKVTWTSLGEEVASANVEYNSQPTKPAADPTYTCGIGTKYFAGWTTEEIDGIGIPTNLYTDEFPVVTEAVTYYAVFAGKSTEASVVTNTLLVTEKLGNYTSGSMTDDQQNVWNYFAGGLENTGTYYLALRNNDSETSYIESPKFVGTVQSIVAHVKNGSSSKVRTVYLRSSAITKPTEGDLGETSIPTSNDTEVNLNITSTFDKFYIQVSDGLQFHKIVVTSGIAAGAYIDYITSCEAVTSSITIEDVTMTVGDTHTITATVTPATAASAIKYTIKENEANAISLDGNTITALKEGTAIITATIEETVNYTGTTVDFTVTVNPAPITDKVVILAQLKGQWYAMTGAYVSGKTNVLSAIPVEYINGTLYNVAEADKASIEWQRSMNGNKAIFKNGDNYLTGGTNADLTLKTTEFEWDYNGVNYLCNDGKRTFLYCENTKTNVFGFKNYAISNAGSVKSNSDGTTESYSSTPVVTTPVYRTATFYTRSELTVGSYGTICLPYAVNNFTGATFYEVAGKEDNKIVFDEVTELEAGKPYIFMAEAAEIKLAQVGEEYTGSAKLHNSLQGTFTQIDPAETNALTGNYIMYNNIIKKCGANCGLQAYRAYFVAGKLESLGIPSAQMPGRSRVTMGVTGENEATGVDNITENGAIAPALQGTYDIMGRQLAEPTTSGFYIINGKKVFVVK